MLASIQKVVYKIQNNSLLSIIVMIGGMWLFRGFLLIKQAFPFHADEAIVGLMAKHILQGERPIFFYGQVYMGSLDAYLIAVFFRLFGEEIIWIRLVQLGLFSLTLLEFYGLMQLVFENKAASFRAGMLFAFPVVNVVLYTTVSLGGYGEALVLGMAALLLAAWYATTWEKASGRTKQEWMVFVGLGVVGGLGLWANALSVLFFIPAMGLMVWVGLTNRIKFRVATQQFISIGGGFLAGAAIWLYGLFQQGSIVFAEMFGSAVSVENISFWERSLQHLISFFLFAPTVVLGFRPPWSVNLILLPVIPIVILFWIITLKKIKLNHFTSIQKAVFVAVLGIGMLVFLGYGLTSFGVDPSGRYFLPFALLLSMLAGLAVKGNKWVRV